MRDFEEQMAKAELALKKAMDAKAALKSEADWRRRNELKILRAFKAKITEAGYLSKEDVHEIYEDVVEEVRGTPKGSAAPGSDTTPGQVSDSGGSTTTVDEASEDGESLTAPEQVPQSGGSDTTLGQVSESGAYDT